MRNLFRAIARGLASIPHHYRVAKHEATIRETLETSPHLCNARHYQDYFCMAIFYNSEIDSRMALTYDDVSRIMRRVA